MTVWSPKSRRPSGTKDDAARDDAVGGRRRELFSVKPNAAFDRPQNARDRLEASALARTVAADQRHELAVADRQAGAPQRFDRAVSDAQIANLEHGPRPMGEQELVRTAPQSLRRQDRPERRADWPGPRDGAPSASFSP